MRDSENGFLLEAVGIVKRFGDFTANDHVSICLNAGDIHALLVKTVLVSLR